MPLDPISFQPDVRRPMSVLINKQIHCGIVGVPFRCFVMFAFFAISMISVAPADEPHSKSGESAIAHTRAARWEPTIKAFEASDATSKPPENALLLVGGSNARRWTDVDQYFPHHHVINRGFGGARLTEVLYFADRIVLPYKPTTILLNAGGNDLSSGQSPEQIRDTARDFIAKVHGDLPDTRIYFLGLPLVRRSFTTPKVRALIEKTNELLAQLAATEKQVEFIDLAHLLLSDHGKFRPELYVSDGTHFSAKGYAVISRWLSDQLGD